MVLQGLSTLVPPTAAAAPSSSSRAKGEAKSFKMQRLSDPQTKELAALFEFLDTDNDGLLGLAQATALCRQLGFNVDKASVAQRGDGAAAAVSLRDLLAWAEHFVDACATGEEYRLTQAFMLLQRGDDGGVTVEAVRDALNAERLPFEEDEVHALVEYMANEGEARGAATFADFKAFMRKGERMRASAEADSGDEDGGSPATGARAGGGSPGARGGSGAGRLISSG